MAGGRFCDACQKPVIDFTGWGREELIAYFRAKPDTCGQFEPHQVGRSLIPIDQLGQGMRRGLFASLVALAAGTLQAQEAPTPTATEQGIVPAIPATVPPGTDHITSNPRKPWAVDTPAPATEKKRKRHRVYVSKRFPFVHVRRRHLKGRVVGCPAF